MEHRGRPLPDFLVRQIRRLRRAGRSIRDIARLVGVSPTTVQKHLRAPWDDSEGNPCRPPESGPPPGRDALD